MKKSSIRKFLIIVAISSLIQVLYLTYSLHEVYANVGHLVQLVDALGEGCIALGIICGMSLLALSITYIGSDKD